MQLEFKLLSFAVGESAFKAVAPTFLKAIDENWDELNRKIDEVFSGKKVRIKRIK